MGWVTKITTVSFMMVIPPLVGYYLDGVCGTVVLFMFLGAMFGVAAGIWQLVRLVNEREIEEKEEEEKASP